MRAVEETIVYKSKIGWIVRLPLIFIVGNLMYILFSNKISWLTISLLLLVLLFIVYVVYSIKYILEKDVLIIRGGFIYNAHFEIKSITKIKETNNPLSAPAASLDRLEISYHPNNLALISPENKREFIHHLKTINPSIEVELKAKNN